MRSLLLAVAAAHLLRQPAVGNVDFGPGFQIPMVCHGPDGDFTLTPTLQVAVKRPEQSQGLMFRKEMDVDAGMVFLWPEGQKRVLYMRNTYVALDAGWFDGDGHLMEVSPLKPLDESWIWSTSDQIHFAVEMNLGWYDAHCPGSSKGGKLDMDLSSLATAVSQHGDDPGPFIASARAPAATAENSTALLSWLRNVDVKPVLP